jgi:outer membrane protein OmpA-like peptidoglycan-associated protein
MSRGPGIWGISALLLLISAMAGGAWLFATERGEALWLEIKDALPVDTGSIGLTATGDGGSEPGPALGRPEPDEVVRAVAATEAAQTSAATASSGTDAAGPVYGERTARGDIAAADSAQRPSLGDMGNDQGRAPSGDERADANTSGPSIDRAEREDPDLADAERDNAGISPATAAPARPTALDDGADGNGRSESGTNDQRPSAAPEADRRADASAGAGSATSSGPAGGSTLADAETPGAAGAALDEAQSKLAGLGIQVDRREQGALVANLGDFVQFQTGSVEPDGEARRFIAEVAARLMPALPVAIRVVGHTDRVGSVWVNNWLSEQRAAAVAQILAENGIPTTLLSHEGKGETEPLIEPVEADPAGSAVNRRIELHVTRVLTGANVAE